MRPHRRPIRGRDDLHGQAGWEALDDYREQTGRFWSHQQQQQVRDQPFGAQYLNPWVQYNRQLNVSTIRSVGRTLRSTRPPLQLPVTNRQRYSIQYRSQYPPPPRPPPPPPNPLYYGTLLVRPRSDASQYWYAANETPAPRVESEITMTQRDPRPTPPNGKYPELIEDEVLTKLEYQGIGIRERQDILRLAEHGFNITTRDESTRNGWEVKTVGTGMNSRAIYGGTYGPKVLNCKDRYARELEGVRVGQEFVAKYMVLCEPDWNVYDFQHEKEVIKYVLHPNIVRIRLVVNLGERKSMEFEGRHQFHFYTRVFLVMDKADQGSLELFQEAREFNSQPVVDYTFRGLCYGLQYLHNENITHQDIHAGNALIFTNPRPTGADDRFVAKWTDFGRSKWFGNMYNSPYEQPLTRDSFEAMKSDDRLKLGHMFDEIFVFMSNYTEFKPLAVDTDRMRELARPLMDTQNPVKSMDEFISKYLSPMNPRSKL